MMHIEETLMHQIIILHKDICIFCAIKLHMVIFLGTTSFQPLFNEMLQTFSNHVVKRDKW